MDTSTRLPVELLHQIFSYPDVCGIDDESFADTDPISHLAHVSRSTAISVLLVCKLYLCIAAPLVYNTILLRSRNQAHSLMRTLRKNKALGLHVRKLRVEGGFGADMNRILHWAPRITDI
jgi:hypothetical protein